MVIHVFLIWAFVFVLLKNFKMKLGVGECGESACLSSVEFCSVTLMDVLTLKNCNDNMYSAIHSEMCCEFI